MIKATDAAIVANSTMLELLPCWTWLMVCKLELNPREQNTCSKELNSARDPPNEGRGRKRRLLMENFINNLPMPYCMSLHHDFPYEAANLYCKSCKETTLHNKPIHDFICSKCDRKWDELLMQVNLKQNKYSKLQCECIVLSDKQPNSREYPAKYFDSIDKCVEWFREKAIELSKATK
jgi:hypothetical protein